MPDATAAAAPAAFAFSEDADLGGLWLDPPFSSSLEEADVPGESSSSEDSLSLSPPPLASPFAFAAAPPAPPGEASFGGDLRRFTLLALALASFFASSACRLPPCGSLAGFTFSLNGVPSGGLPRIGRPSSITVIL